MKPIARAVALALYYGAAFALGVIGAAYLIALTRGTL